MHSIRTKIALLAVVAVMVTVVIATALGATSIQQLGKENSDQLLLLLCETGEKNLDSYFDSVEQSVELEASFISEDIRGLDDKSLAEHVERSSRIFEQIAYKTNGVLTYYYRIDPELSGTVKGFWYTNLDGNGFVEHEPTDISRYDTSDTSQLVWFTVPKNTGEAVWLPPYITDNLDKRVISYNYPIYHESTFVGVVGIEIDYSTMAEQVDNIQLFKDGYAFINDEEGNIIYHPRISIEELAENPPKVPDGLLSEASFVEYNFKGVARKAVWLPLHNGMRLNVSVPVSELDGHWEELIFKIVIASLILIAVFVALTLALTKRITRPLEELAEAAKQVGEGNYDVEITYGEDDEVGVLSKTFNQVISHLKSYIGDLSSLAYADALTSVRNKGAFDIFIREIQTSIDTDPDNVHFAIIMFDCDDLKSINDTYGHDKGNIYLTAASHLVCRVFTHSPVFRLGGDEFAAILQGEDYRSRDALVEEFHAQAEKRNAVAENEWECVRVSMGMAVYEPGDDTTAGEVARHADKLMYADKHARKAERTS